MTSIENNNRDRVIVDYYTLDRQFWGYKGLGPKRDVVWMKNNLQQQVRNRYCGAVVQVRAKPNHQKYSISVLRGPHVHKGQMEQSSIIYTNLQVQVHIASEKDCKIEPVTGIHLASIIEIIETARSSGYALKTANVKVFSMDWVTYENEDGEQTPLKHVEEGIQEYLLSQQENSETKEESN